MRWEEIADNAIYPIAWAVFQVENTENWLWFVEKKKHELDLKDGNGFVLVSDRQIKGLFFFMFMLLFFSVSPRI